MKTVVLSLLAGCLVGVIYGLLKVRSPAPPVVALIGLLGILIGEHLVNFVRTSLTPAQVITFQEKNGRALSTGIDEISKAETKSGESNGEHL